METDENNNMMIDENNNMTLVKSANNYTVEKEKIAAPVPIRAKRQLSDEDFIKARYSSIFQPLTAIC